MTTIIQYEPDQLLADLAIQWVDEEDGEQRLASSIRTVNTWLERGDGVAIYENQDLGHWALGHKIFLSFGSTDAQIERSSDLPASCPIELPHGMMAWRYQLVGTYRGESL